MANARDVYRSVWSRANECDATVSYWPFKTDKAGLFYPYEATAVEHEANPTITICRLKAGGAVPRLDGIDNVQVTQELCTLAHECGHFLWWKRGWDGDTDARAERNRYQLAMVHFDEVYKRANDAPSAMALNAADFTRGVAAAMQRELTEDERTLILDEEQRAWDLGRELLQEFQFDDMPAYEIRALEGLHNYHVRFGLAPVV